MHEGYLVTQRPSLTQKRSSGLNPGSDHCEPTTHNCALPSAGGWRRIGSTIDQGVRMSITRRTVIAGVAALALGGTMVASTAPADAHTYKTEGTASAKEARKLFKETFKQKCLTVHEARHIVHGSGNLSEDTYADGEVDSYRVLYFRGTKKSHIARIDLHVDVDTGCVNYFFAFK